MRCAGVEGRLCALRTDRQNLSSRAPMAWRSMSRPFAGSAVQARVVREPLPVLQPVFWAGLYRRASKLFDAN